MTARKRPTKRTASRSRRNDGARTTYVAIREWTSRPTDLRYRLTPSSDGWRVAVEWADKFRGVRDHGRTVFERLARAPSESLAPTLADAKARTEAFDAAFLDEAARRNGRGALRAHRPARKRRPAGHHAVRRNGRGDPFWMTAKFAGKDADGNAVRKGDRIFFYPRTKTVLTGDRAEKAAREFADALRDEESYG